MKVLSLLAFLIFSGFSIYAQNANQYIQGYESEVSGKRFGYHSPIPGVTASLISRGSAEYPPIVWETAKVPKNHKDRFVTFIWVFGMDVITTPVNFDLSVNNEKLLTFSSSRKSETGLRTFDGIEGSSLTFNSTMLDQHNDQMGFAILKVPTKMVGKGKAAEISIKGQPANNNAWYMTFKTGVSQDVKLYQNQVVAKRDGKLFHSISADFVHIGDDSEATVTIDGTTTKLKLVAGFNKAEIYLPKTDAARTLTAEIEIPGLEKMIQEVALTPVREWEIYFVQHTHSDIGYTRPQSEILPEHLRYIDNALDFCDQTDDYPEASQFRWTCETSWSVREYLRARPQAQIDRLLQRIKEGRIEATGMFFNYSEIIDESALAAQTKTLRMLQNAGIDVSTAMQNDVNGIAWSMVDYFKATDVKYLTMGVHAHRARKPFNKPTSFWWESPAGNRLMAYRSEHYMHGNMLALTTGQQDLLRTNLSSYLTSLEEREYPYNKISLQFSGYLTDNSPPSVKVCDIIREWNDKYEWPKLRSSLAKDFMEWLDEEHSNELPVKQVAWPDWWTDGVGSAANETKVVRNTHVEIAANTAALAMARMTGTQLPENIQDEIEHVYDNLLFYDEHTHGASESVRDPLAQNTVNQWSMKAAYAWEAVKASSMLQEKALALVEPAIGRSNVPTIAVFNTLNWKRSKMVEMFIPYEVIDVGTDFVIKDETGKSIPVQVMEKRAEGAYYALWVPNVPGFGYKTLDIILGEKPSEMEAASTPLENEFYKLTLEPEKGIIGSLLDKQLNKELITQGDSLNLGQVIYEQLANRHEMERLTNTNRDTVYRPLTMKRTMMSNVQVVHSEEGAIFNSTFLQGDLPECADERGVAVEVRLYNHEKKLELRYSMHKLNVTDPEGVYVAFPFQLDDGKLAFEVQGGVVNPGENQLEGTASDWNTIQNFAAVRNGSSQIVFSSPEIPLVQFGAINTGRYYYRLRPQTNHIYSWVLNNYWVTNFKASQFGELRWTYAIGSIKDQSNKEATRFGWGNRVPLLTRLMLPQKGAAAQRPTSKSFLSLDKSNLLLVNTTPALEGDGIILQVRELDGQSSKIQLGDLLDSSAAKSAIEVNSLENELSEISESITIQPYDTRFIKLIY